jgi:hypothetical protein
VPTIVRLTDMPDETSFAPLGVLGYCLTRSQFLAPVWAELDLPLKTVAHTPQAKLLDIVVSMLTGCRALAQVNTRLRPDIALARAWGRDRFADQSTLTRTLDAFSATEVAQLRHGSNALFQRHSYALRHDFGLEWLWLDIDLTPLPISKHAEGSTKGKFNQKNRYGRQLARVHAPQYHETLFSWVYPGNQESSSAYVPTLNALETFLKLTPAQRQRTVLRSDAGFGSDANINRALSARWQVLTKNKGGGRRPLALARQVATDAWQPLGAERWVAPAVNRPTYVCPSQCLVFRWLNQSGEVKYSVIVCSVTTWSMAETVAYYDDRGQCETEIQQDKGGLKLERRRKRRLAAQEALVLLTDLAHNLLAWVPQWMFPGEPLVALGATRLIEDVFHLPGRLYFCGGRLTEVRLNRLHPHAQAVAAGLERLLAHFGHP